MDKKILNNYNKLKKNIKEVCKKINRNPNDINLVSVSKASSISEIEILINNEHRCFGENRLNNAMEKWKELKKDNVSLHFIGALQSKKVKKIINFFDVIETLDTESSASEIAKCFQEKDELKYKKKIYVQVNIGQEIQKRGVLPTDLTSFLMMCKKKYGLDIYGAMCMAPLNQNPGFYFKKMKEICDINNIRKISMGMSNDYNQAIINGSTNIRVGSLIFGKT